MMHAPASLALNPRIGDWIRIPSDGKIHILSGKVELGQGILTALAQIAAEELDCRIERIEMVTARTDLSPNEGVTSGSLSIRDSGQALRLAATNFRHLFLAEAGRRLNADLNELRIEDGCISTITGQSLTYWQLAKWISLDVDIDSSIAPKPVEARTVSGAAVRRLDIPGRVFGERPFIHDLDFDAMLHGRVLRPPRPGAKLESVDVEKVRANQGVVKVVVNGSFFGVVCKSEAEADRALSVMATTSTWSGGFNLPDVNDLPTWLKSQEADQTVVDTRASAQETLKLRPFVREYSKPFLAHASIGPSCAIARWKEGHLEVISHTQGIYNLRDDLSIVFDLPKEHIVVAHTEGSGCYGHNGADDVALDAALLARAVNEDYVRVRWSRRDELTCSPFGAAMTVRIVADLDAGDAIRHWEHHVWSNGHVARPGRSRSPRLLAGFDLSPPFPRPPSEDPPLASGGGSERNAIPIYTFPSWKISKSRILNTPLRTSSMRALGAYGNVFAIESFLDELAADLNTDPVAFRLGYLDDQRAAKVLQEAARMAEWGGLRPEGVGLGIAMARYKNTGAYCAVAAEVDVNEEPRATRLWIAVDVGEVINPDGVVNQIEGGAIQSVSWTLKEAVNCDRGEITSGSWEDYSIIRFEEVPLVEVHIIDRPDQPPLGAGEASQGPTAAAVANAVFAALGIRVRHLPITRNQIIAAME